MAENGLGLVEFGLRLVLAAESIAASLKNIAEESIKKDPYKRETEIHKLRASRARTYEDDADYAARMDVYKMELKSILDKNNIEYARTARTTTLERLITSNIENAKLPTKPVRSLEEEELEIIRADEARLVIPPKDSEMPAIVAVDPVAPEVVAAVVEAIKPTPVVPPKVVKVIDRNVLLEKFKSWVRTKAPTDADVRGVALAQLRMYRVEKFSDLTDNQLQGFEEGLV